MLRPSGDRLFYRVVGSGADTVVLLPGGPMLSSRYLEEAFAGLDGNHAFLAVDLRGRGRSSTVREPASLGLDVDVADLEAIREHLALQSFAVLAHHWGSAVALKYAMRFPGHIARAVFIAPFPTRRSSSSS